MVYHDHCPTSMALRDNLLAQSYGMVLLIAAPLEVQGEVPLKKELIGSPPQFFNAKGNEGRTRVSGPFSAYINLTND